MARCCREAGRVPRGVRVCSTLAVSRASRQACEVEEELRLGALPREVGVAHGLEDGFAHAAAF